MIHVHVRLTIMNPDPVKHLKVGRELEMFEMKTAR
jgi:hypothetical protein